MQRPIRSSNVSNPSQISNSNRNEFGYANSEVVGSYRYKNGTADLPLNNPHLQSQEQKKRVKVYQKQQRQSERRRVQESESRKKELNRHQRQKVIMEELSTKKRELQQLQNLKKRALEEEKRSHELAIIKIQQDAIRRIEEQNKSKENQQNANIRFSSALRRLEDENKEKDFKKNQAMHRRKVCEENQRIQRGKAIQYQTFADERQRQEVRKQNEKERVEFVDFRQPMGRNAYAKNHNVDYSKTYSHNPQIVFARRCLDENESSPQKNAMEQAKILEEIQRSNSAKRRISEQEQRRRSLERGRKAIIKVQREKEYEEYSREADGKALQYNLQKIEQGKKNQFTGIFPGTLQQMQTNKKIRSQDEFQKTFLNRNNPQWIANREATRYEIIQARQPNKSRDSSSEKEIIIKKFNIPVQNDGFYRGTQASLVPGVSTGKYSFEDSDGLQGLTSVKKQEEILKNYQYSESDRRRMDDSDQQDEAPRQLPKPKHVEPIMYENKQLADTNYQDRKVVQEKRDPLADSLDVMRQGKVVEEKRRIVYQNQSPGTGAGNGQKGSLVSNVCQNRRREQDLNYSESQEDSYV